MTEFRTNKKTGKAFPLHVFSKGLSSNSMIQKAGKHVKPSKIAKRRFKEFDLISFNELGEIIYEGYPRKIIAKDVDENTVNEFLQKMAKESDIENLQRLVVQKSIPIPNSKLPENKIGGYMFSIMESNADADIVHDQFWIFENQDHKFDIVNV